MGVLILPRKLFVDPEELLALVHYADQAAEAGVFLFHDCVKLAQGGTFNEDGRAVW